MKQIYCIPRLDQINKYLSFAEEYNAGFEYNDFYFPFILDDPAKVETTIRAYKALDRDRSEDTLHGVFLDICINSDDPLIYEVSNRRVHQSMEIAKELGVKAVIFHTNYIPCFYLQMYRDGWVVRNEKYWRSIIKEYPTIKVYIENMFDESPELLQKLALAMKDEPNFGVCFDAAHGHISSTPFVDWCDALAGHITHLHLNDNDGVEDTHNAVGDGTLPWEEYRSLITPDGFGNLPTVLLEVRSYEDLLSSVAYMKEHHMYPFN